MNTQEKIQNAINWIDTLSITKSKQGKGELGDKKRGFCCLGLGCYILNIHYNPEDEFNEEFQDAVGLLDMDGQFHTNESLDHESLAELNDSGKYSFKQIADIIKENFYELFKKDVASGLTKHYKI